MRDVRVRVGIILKQVKDARLIYEIDPGSNKHQEMTAGYFL
jgi:hypothetical protein